MLELSQFDPVAFSVFGFSVRWYALMYILGFGFAWLLARYRIRQGQTFFTHKLLDDVLFYCMLGVILGGRLGYIVFYQPSFYFSHPVEMLNLTNGGMSFHGGLIGVLVAIAYTAWRNQRHYMEIADFVAPLVPLGLAVGRIGNFINQELWGRATDGTWGFVFYTDPLHLPRHPSQLYQAALEGLLLFVVVWWFSRRPRPIGQVGGVFMIGYGICRFIAEYFREPDSYLGFVLGHLSMGQLLSLPMVIVGVFIIVWSRRQPLSQVNRPTEEPQQDIPSSSKRSQVRKKRK